MANIQNLRTIERPQKAYMWEVEVQGLASGALADMAMFAQTVSIPQTSVEQIVKNHKGGRTHYAGRDASGHTVTVSFFDDEDMTIYSYFSDWMGIIHDQDTAGSASRDQYASNLLIKLKDTEDETVTGRITLSKAFPTEIAEVSLNYDGSDTVEISVTFSFDRKTVERGPAG